MYVPWMRCADGSLMEPLDIIHFVLFRYGPPVADEFNMCWVARHFTVPALEQMLPSSNGVFVVEDFIDSVVCLLICIAVVTVAIFAVYGIWNKIDESFSTINPSHKKWYVVANLSKALLLGVQALSFNYWWGMYTSYIHGRYIFQLELKRCTVLYACTDVVALYMVPKLQRSTILHHVTTLLMAMVVWGVDVTQSNWDGTLGIVKMIIIYGECSTMAFMVNAYLALRVVYPKARWLRTVCLLALVSYVLCCTVNWSLHIVWLYGCIVNMDISALTVAYMMGLGFVINDDIKLIKWLIEQRSLTSIRDKQA